MNPLKSFNSVKLKLRFRSVFNTGGRHPGIAFRLLSYSYASSGAQKPQEKLPLQVNTHFKGNGRQHPLKISTSLNSNDADEIAAGDHTGRQQNHIWTKEELDVAMSTLYRHKPVRLSDHIMNKLVRVKNSCHCLYFKSIIK